MRTRLACSCLGGAWAVLALGCPQFESNFVIASDAGALPLNDADAQGFSIDVSAAAATDATAPGDSGPTDSSTEAVLDAAARTSDAGIAVPLPEAGPAPDGSGGLCLGATPEAGASTNGGDYVTDATPVLVPTSNGYDLRKTLTGYGPYSADVLYNGQTGAYTFPLVSGRAVASASVTLEAVAEYDSGQPWDATFAVWLNGCAFDPTAPFLVQSEPPYGDPWTGFVSEGPYPASPEAGATYVVSVTNTSSLNPDFIVLSSITLHVVLQ
jgi:hypothetical protein